jgi:hypothetical protein
MLTEEEKKRITMEEIFREEVRKDLASKKQKSFFRKLWVFLNTAFGLWFLSTIVIGLATFSYTALTQYDSDRLKQKESIKMLDIEITTRLYNFELTIRKVFNASWDLAQYEGVRESRMEFSLAELDGHSAFLPDKNSNTNVFPGYKNRTFQSLLIELHGLVPDSEKTLIKQSLDSLSTIKEMLFSFPDGQSVEDLERMQNQIMKLVKTCFNLDRWPWIESTGENKQD